MASLESLRNTFRSYLASTLAIRADAAEDRDDVDAALDARREILQIKSRLLGDQNWEVADARRDLSELERKSRRTPEDAASSSRLSGCASTPNIMRSGHVAGRALVAEKASPSASSFSARIPPVTHPA